MTKTKSVSKSGSKKKLKTAKHKSSKEQDNLKKESIWLKENTKWRNKFRTLALLSRRPTYHSRYLLKDLAFIIPNIKLEAKLDCRDNMRDLMELADLHDCQAVAYLQTIKLRDYYLFLGNAPKGPTAKFQISGMHTIKEMRTAGNALQFSRPLLSFSSNFDDTPQGEVLKHMLANLVNVPLYHPKSKPFIDRVYHFNLSKEDDYKITFRHYQVDPSLLKTSLAKDKKPEITDLELNEIGPRFTLQLMRIWGGAFGGPTLFQNEKYLSPIAIRKQIAVQSKEKALLRLRTKDNRIAAVADAHGHDDVLNMQAVFSSLEEDEEEGDD